MAKLERIRESLKGNPVSYTHLDVYKRQDTYGEASVRKGLAQVVSLLRGQEVGYQDIRAAIENVTCLLYTSARPGSCFS